jgi:DNA-binding NarL/FixJ family response regulator
MIETLKQFLRVGDVDESIRVMVMDRYPVTHAGIQAMISQARLGMVVAEDAVGNLADGLGLACIQRPNLVLVDAALPASPENLQPANLFSACQSLRRRLPEQAVILIVHAPPVSLEMLALVVRNDDAQGIIGKRDLSAYQLRQAVETTCLAQRSYLYVDGARRLLADLVAGSEFFWLSPEKRRLIETLTQSTDVRSLATQHNRHLKTMYRLLEALALSFGMARWRDIPVRVSQLGIVSQGRVLSQFALKYVARSSALARPRPEASCMVPL